MTNEVVMSKIEVKDLGYQIQSIGRFWENGIALGREGMGRMRQRVMDPGTKKLCDFVDFDSTEDYASAVAEIANVVKVIEEATAIPDPEEASKERPTVTAVKMSEDVDKRTGRDVKRTFKITLGGKDLKIDGLTLRIDSSRSDERVLGFEIGMMKGEDILVEYQLNAEAFRRQM